MNSGARFVHWIVWGLLAMVVAGVAGIFLTTILRSRAQPLPIYGQISDFTLTNHLGKSVSLGDLRGQIWVADIIFTRCTGPCPVMTSTMKSLQDKLPPGNPVKLVSLTADPEFDTPAVLKEYANQFGVDSARWWLLTGPKKDIYDLAIQGLKLAVQEMEDGKPAADQFIHSTRFVLVDGKGQLRGVSFEGAGSVDEVLSAVRQLMAETR